MGRFTECLSGPSDEIPQRSNPRMVGWLAALIGGGALVALSVDVLPYWPIEHKHVDLAIGAFMLPVGIVLWFARRHIRLPIVHGCLLAGVGAITAAVWAAGPTAESQAPALFYVFLSTFVSAFLVLRQAMAYLALAGVAYLVALLLHWRAEMATQWTINMVAFALPCAIIGGLVAQLRTQAGRDPLTGLANRRLFEQLLPTEIALAARGRRPLSVVAIDLDGLKAINDTAGHAAGDQFLLQAARGFRSALRAGDSLARVGGDEFTLLLPDADTDTAYQVVQRLRRATPQIAFSAGVVTWDGEPADELLNRADAALYAAKRSRGTPIATDQSTRQVPIPRNDRRPSLEPGPDPVAQEPERECQARVEKQKFPAV